MAVSNPDSIKIVDEGHEDGAQKFQLYIDGGRRAVLRKDTKGKITLEIEIFGAFDWPEMAVFMIGLNRLGEVAEKLQHKTDVQRLLHKPTEEEIEMAKSKAKAKAAKAAKKSGDKKPRESAAGMFKELIMEGKHTDDQIFAKVKAKHGLDDSKRSYVAWYRNSLVKAGKKPPAAKE